MRVVQLMSARIGRARLSYERLSNTLVGDLAGVACFMDVLAFSPDLRPILRNKRTTQSPIESPSRP